MPTGANLIGGRVMPGPMQPPAGPTGADLARGPQMRPPGPMDGQEGGGNGELDQAIAAVIEAAKSVGFELPQQGVPPEQMMDLYAQLIGAAAQSEMGRTPYGQQMISGLAQVLGIPSPFGGQEGPEGKMGPTPGGQPPGGMPPLQGVPPRY